MSAEEINNTGLRNLVVIVGLTFIDTKGGKT